MKTVGLWLVIVWTALTAQTRAHPADVTHLLLKVDRHEARVRLTFNLLTLMRFVPIDADQNGELALEELTAAEAKLADYLKERIPVSINGSDETRLAPLESVRPVWPTSEKPTVPAVEYESHWVDVDCKLSSEELIEDVWIGFEFFEDTGYAHTVQGFFEQGGNRLEVPFTAAEPGFLYDTGFKAEDEAPPTAIEEDSVSPPIAWVALLLGAALAGWIFVSRLARARDKPNPVK